MVSQKPTVYRLRQLRIFRHMDAVGNVERALLAQLQAGHTADTSPLLARVLRNNRILLHNYRAPSIKDCRCDLEGCTKGFSVILIPNQALYPRYCSAHRTEHRRALHRERLATLNAVLKAGSRAPATDPAPTTA